MRKPDFCICENKRADQLCSNCTADQRLCIRYSDSTTHLLLIAKISRIFDCTCRFVSYLVGMPEDRFSRVAAHLEVNNNVSITIFRIRQAIKKNDKGLIGTYCMQAAKILNSEQRARLPSDVKEKVIKKYDLIQERHKLSLMGEAEKKEYLAKQAAERKEKMRQQMKERQKKLRKVRKKPLFFVYFLRNKERF